MFKGSKYRTGAFSMNLDLGCEEITIGDLNCDQIIDVSDIVIIVNMVLQVIEVDMIADMNDDNSLDIIDIVQIVSLILNN